jgi:hypothetical protein
MRSNQRKFRMKNKIKSENGDVSSIKFEQTNNGFHKFCLETGLHGWSYLIRDMSKPWKIVWFIFLLMVCFISLYVLFINTLQYAKTTTVTTIESPMAPLKDVTFPSLYICNINQVCVSSVFLKPLFVHCLETLHFSI